MNKNTLIAIGVIVVLLALGIFYFGMSKSSVQGTASPQGTSLNDTKQAAVTINLANPGANATSTSILNTDGNDRFITSEHAVCEGVGTSQTAYTGAGLASLTLKMATSSTAAPTTNANTNTLPTVTVSTTTPNFGISSSTVATPGNNLVSNVWAAGSYLTISANATNTALCTVGVNYLQL
jgi:hypothetical protein